MKYFLLVLTAVFLPSGVMASEAACANMAKFGAIRAYKAEMGTVQGSPGMEYKATLVGVQGDITDHLVTIADSNEDGDHWQVDYAVRTKGGHGSCKVLFVKKIATR